MAQLAAFVEVPGLCAKRGLAVGHCLLTCVVTLRGGTVLPRAAVFTVARRPSPTWRDHRGGLCDRSGHRVACHPRLRPPCASAGKRSFLAGVPAPHLLSYLDAARPLGAWRWPRGDGTVSSLVVARIDTTSSLVAATCICKHRRRIVLHETDPLTVAACVWQFPLVALGMALLLVCAVSERLPFQRVSIPGAAFLASVAYSVYLSHKLAIHWVLAFCAAHQLKPDSAAGVALNLGVIVLVGTLLFFAVERPFLQLRRRTKYRPATLTSEVPLMIVAPSDGKVARPSIGCHNLSKTVVWQDDFR